MIERTPRGEHRSERYTPPLIPYPLPVVRSSGILGSELAQKVGLSAVCTYDEILWWPEARLENLQLQDVICREVLFVGFARPMDPVARSKPVICMARSLRVV